MKYNSTRSNTIVSDAHAILSGLSSDGGLYVPSEIPEWSSRLEQLSTLSYSELVYEVIVTYFDSFKDDEQFKNQILVAYNSFDTDDIVPIKVLDEKLAVAELYHGKTCAFKDFALQVLPFEIMAAKRVSGQGGQTYILTATSGDTGKATLESFGNVEGFKVAVIYPKSGVSKIQQLQMTSVDYPNCLVVGLDDNFDKAQQLVKEMFLSGENVFASANSINIARLIPQVAYYFYIYFNLVSKGAVNGNERINFSVPTGNFGDILAGYLAKQMGLPIDKLICASNANNVLTDFFNTGIYDINRKFILTSSPSMDILISSNLERLLYLICNDTNTVSQCMNSLATSGRFDFTKYLGVLKQHFVAGFCNDLQVNKSIKSVFDEYSYLIDTHTAVAFGVSEKLNSDKLCVVLSTASAYKFPVDVYFALSGAKVSEAEAMEYLQQLTSTICPNQLKDVLTAHEVNCFCGDKESVKKEILNFGGVNV